MAGEDEFKALKSIRTPPATPEARRQALGASLMAFDQAAEAAAKPAEEKSASPPQGSSWASRLKSIVPTLKGQWIMDSRRFVPAGTAALALLILLPLGYQLYSSTALTPALPKVAVAPLPEPVAQPASQTPMQPAGPANTATSAPLKDLDTTMPAIGGNAAVPAETAVATTPTTPPVDQVLKSEDARDSAPELAALPGRADAHNQVAAQAPVGSAVGGLAGKPAPVMEKPSAPPPVEAASIAAPADQPMLADEGAVAPAATAAMAAVAPAPAAMDSLAAGVAQPESFAKVASAPSMSGRAATTVTGDKFANFTESAQKAVATEPVSTFSIDVDTASYSYVRRALNEGRIPEPDAVRIEELVNYFPYDYPAATSASAPFKPTISVFPTPWNKSTELMEIGIKGYDPPAAARQPSNLVFLIDTSGSMDEPDKLPLLQRALGLLVNTLSPKDTVSIVAYAGSAGVVLEPTGATDKAKILSALDNLEAGGSTAGAEGIELAYQLAEQHKIDGNNRVILATDGDFNVGISDPDQLKQFIKQKRQAGIGLSVLGFGEGNLDDATMQALAQNGDGNASYIDTLSEAQKVLVKEAGSTLDTIAKDVKIQVEFNPATVSSYRLIGYETRALNREDFNNDKVDAGDVGAGHTVTALYEITPAGADAAPPVDALRYGSSPAIPAPAAAPAPEGKGAELADVKLRYKLPGSDTSQLIEQPVTPAMVVSDNAKASDDARWAAAVAAFGQKLRGSDYAGAMSYGEIGQLARSARGADPEGYRAEFINLVGLAASLSGDESTPPTSPEPGPLPPIVN